MIRKSILIAVTAIVASAPILGAVDADAKPYKKGGHAPWTKTYDVPGPVHGYEGFVGIGKFRSYCSYKRIPVHGCTITKSGHERCGVVRWTLEQTCY